MSPRPAEKAMAGSNLYTGTLDLLVLKAISWGPRPGYAIGRWIREPTAGVHLDMRRREFVERGRSPEDARRAAAASFGDVEAIEAECRDERAIRAREHARRDWLQGVGLDLKVALRGLWRRPAFTAAATLTLTLGS